MVPTFLSVESALYGRYEIVFVQDDILFCERQKLPFNTYLFFSIHGDHVDRSPFKACTKGSCSSHVFPAVLLTVQMEGPSESPEALAFLPAARDFVLAAAVRCLFPLSGIPWCWNHRP